MINKKRRAIKKIEERLFDGVDVLKGGYTKENREIGKKKEELIKDLALEELLDLLKRFWCLEEDCRQENIRNATIISGKVHAKLREATRVMNAVEELKP